MKLKLFVLSVLFTLSLPILAKVVTTPPKGLNIVDWKQIRAEYERHRHGAFPEPGTSGGLQARSFEQQWLAHFDGRGFTVAPNEGAWRWGLELAGVTGKAKVTTDVNRITYRWSANLEEWYLNDTRGLEHGFTLRAPQPEIRLDVRGGLKARETAEGIEFVEADGVARMKYTGLKAWDAAGKTVPARMAVRGGQLVLTVEDRGARYPVTIDPIAQQAYLKASNTDWFDNFGVSVAVSGDTVVVGANQEASSATGVNGNQSDNSKAESGAAYVFVRAGLTWSQQAYLKASNTDSYDHFGYSVAVSGDTVVVGAFVEDSNATGVNGNQTDNSKADSGAVYVYVRSGTTWSQQAYLKASNTDSNDQFGLSVAISGDTIVVGASSEDSSATGVNGNQGDQSAPDSGAAYVFFRNGNNWSQQAYLKASNPSSADVFGGSVAISGDTVVVGSFSEGSNATGAAYVFARAGSSWSQQAYLQASNPDYLDLFGIAVSVSGDTVVVGARWEDSNATGVNGTQSDNSKEASGAAYVFVRNGSTWSQQAYLKASNPDISDNLGVSVAVSGDTVVLGAYGESSSATGVNGNQSDNTKPLSGATYVFVRSGSSWSQQAYLKASNPDSYDHFGFAVAVSGDSIVAGAFSEASAATGVNGIQSDNSKEGSGAGYIFATDSSLHALTVTVTGPGTVSDAGLITCPGACSASFSGSVTLTATPTLGNFFSGWSGGGCSGTSTCTVSLASADQAVTATFAAAPDLTIGKSTSSIFTQGGAATYTLTVFNANGAGPTTGPYTISDLMPLGLKVVLPVANVPTGWDCSASSENFLSCTSSTVLQGGGTAYAVAFDVSILGNAPLSVANVATISGGGDQSTQNNSSNTVFSTVNPAAPTSMLPNTGATPQSTAAGTQFANPLSVTVQNGTSPVSGVTVSFLVTSGGAYSANLSSATAVTDLSGVASVTATANATAGGPYQVTATAGALSTFFYLTNLPNTQPVTIDVPSGITYVLNGQSLSGTQTVQLAPGTYTLTTGTPQNFGVVDTQMAFVNWSDGGGLSHPITVGSSPLTITGTFATQYRLTTSTIPVNSGALTPFTGQFFDANTLVPLTATAHSGYVFTSWTGPVVSSNSASTSVLMTGALSIIANFAAEPQGVTVNVPTGIAYTLNGQALTGTQTVQLAPGSYTLTTTTPQSLGAGSQAVFASWSDGGAISHTITVGSSPLSITGSFTTQHQLTIAASPSNAGSVTPATGQHFYDAGTVVPVSMTLNATYSFVNWTGGAVANANAASTTVTMDAPKSIQANCVQQTSVTVNVPAGVTFSLNNQSYTGSQTLQLTPGTYALSTTSPQGFGSEQKVFSNWSDTGAISHSITVDSTSFNIIGSFTTQYKLTTSSIPAQGGTVTPSTDGFHDFSAVVNLTATANPGYVFVNWTGTGVANANAASTTVTMDAPRIANANFAALQGVTVNVPAGVSYTLNSVAYTGSQVINLAPGSYTLATTTPQSLGAGSQAVFASWSDGGAISHTISVGSSPLSITGSFTTQHQLTIAASPSNAGSVTPATGQHFYDAGTVVPISMTPNATYSFVNWTGGAVANANAASTTVTMDAPKSIQANCVQQTSVTVNVPPGVTFSLNNQSYTGTQTVQLAPGTYTLATTSPQGFGSEQKVFSNWSDTGAISHSITVDSTSFSITGSFITQYKLTTSSIPAQGGTVTPATDGFHDFSAVVNLTATANPGYVFVNWTGTGVANANAASTTVTMDAPRIANANFAALQGVTVNVPAGVSYTLNSVAYTGSQVINLAPGSYTLATTTPQSLGAGSQAVFENWSDAGAISHSITVGSSPLTITGAFKIQFELSTGTAPPEGGTVNPATGQFFDTGTIVPLIATANNGFAFTSWTGTVASGNSSSTTVTMNAPKAVIANFSVAQTNVTINVPAGIAYTLNGQAQTGPQTVQLGPGTYILATTATQSLGAGSQSAWQSWSDGGGLSHNITVASSPLTITGHFTTQHQLTILASPSNAGTVTPTTGQFHDAGTVVPVSTTANAGFLFVNWTGGAVANANAAATTVTMDAPKAIQANYTAQTGVTINVPAGIAYTLNGQALTGTQTVQLAPGSYTLATTSPQSLGAGSRAVFDNWSDAGAISHSITVGSSPLTITGTFRTQFELSTGATPANGGTVNQTTGQFFDSGTFVPLIATANNGFTFTSWTGPVSAANSASTGVSMTAPLSVTANFAAQQGVTIYVPVDITYTLNGQVLTGTQTLSLAPGIYTLGTTSPQSYGPGSQTVFVSWSDNGAISHSITVGSSPLSITGTFVKQYRLSIGAAPTNAGTVTPTTDQYHDSGTVVPISAAANAGFVFANWTGAVVANANAAATTVTMDVAKSITANFTAQTGVTVNVPAGISYTLNGQALTGTQTVQLAPGTYTLATTSPQSLGAGARAVFTGWSTGGPISHQVSVGASPITISGWFTTQFQLTAASNPSNGGTVTPATGSFFDSGTVINVTAAPNSGFLFGFWNGPVTNTNLAATTMTMDAAKSITANFTAFTAPIVVTNPQNVSAAPGATATFAAAATGIPAPSVKWQSSTDGTNFTDIAGANSTSYSFTIQLADNGKSYRAVFTNAVSSATTTAARLTSGVSSFIGIDEAAQGNWNGKYGADGFIIANGATRLPSYASVTIGSGGQFPPAASAAAFTWAGVSSEQRALQTNNPATGRIASTFVAPDFSNGFQVRINVNDNNRHQVALYLLDWDSGARAETIRLLDSGGATVDTQALSGFGNGKYAIWSFQGNITITVTGIAGGPALSGIFFDPVGGVPAPTPSFTLTATGETATAGASGSSTVTVVPANGFNAAVTLAALGWPAGITGTFATNPATASSNVTVNVAANVAAGSYQLAVTGTSGVLSATTSIPLTVNAVVAPPLAIGASAVTIAAGASGATTLTQTPLPASGQWDLTLSTPGWPSGITPGTRTNFTLPINVASSVQAGFYQLPLSATNGALSATATVSLTVTGATSTAPSATFIAPADTTAQGTWTGKFGSEGYRIANGANNLPAYAALNLNGAPAFTWATATSDVKALQMSSGSASRIASSYYGNNTFGLNLTDGATHQVSLYLLDWDSGNRSQKIEILNASNDTVLDTQNSTGFGGGLWLSWNLKGNLKIRVTATGGGDGVISGFFFGPASGGGGSPPPVPSFTLTATAAGVTAGSSGAATVLVVPANGFNSPVALAASNWPAGITGVFSPNPTPNTSTVTITVGANVTPGPYSLTVNGTSAAITASTAIVLTVTAAGPTGSSSASFAGTDDVTKGAWPGVFGSKGYLIANGPSAPLTYATANVSGQLSFTWSGQSTDPRALKLAPGSAFGIASAYYQYPGQSFNINLSITDSATHNVSLYLLDWDGVGIADTITVLDTVTGAVLDTQTISGFQNGKYASWNVRGSVTFRVTASAGKSPSVSGVFFD